MFSEFQPRCSWKDGGLVETSPLSPSALAPATQREEGKGRMFLVVERVQRSAVTTGKGSGGAELRGDASAVGVKGLGS